MRLFVNPYSQNETAQNATQKVSVKSVTYCRSGSRKFGSHHHSYLTFAPSPEGLPSRVIFFQVELHGSALHPV